MFGDVGERCAEEQDGHGERHPGLADELAAPTWDGKIGQPDVQLERDRDDLEQVEPSPGSYVGGQLDPVAAGDAGDLEVDADHELDRAGEDAATELAVEAELETDLQELDGPPAETDGGVTAATPDVHGDQERVLAGCESERQQQRAA